MRPPPLFHLLRTLALKLTEDVMRSAFVKLGKLFFGDEMLVNEASWDPRYYFNVGDYLLADVKRVQEGDPKLRDSKSITADGRWYFTSEDGDRFKSYFMTRTVNVSSFESTYKRCKS